MIWTRSWRAEPAARQIADRHYNRQKVGAAQFVPPGRCLVLRAELETGPALWVTSWPFARYVKHDWPGAWVNSLFRNESAHLASDLIRQAVACTRDEWVPPDLGVVTFVDPKAVPGTMVRGERVFGLCYQRAGFEHVGFTRAGLWAWQLTPDRMPPPARPLDQQGSIWEAVADG